MAISNLFSDLYAALSFTEVHAESPPSDDDKDKQESPDEGKGDGGSDEGEEKDEGDDSEGGDEQQEKGGEDEEEEGEEEEEEEDEPVDPKPALEEGMSFLFNLSYWLVFFTHHFCLSMELRLNLIYGFYTRLPFYIQSTAAYPSHYC